MSKQFKISANYWNKLSDKEKEFLQSYAIEHGVQYCKRILTLANKFFNHDYDTIVNLSDYDKQKSAIYESAWIIIKGNQSIGIIQKTYSIGLSERVSARINNKFVEIWNDYNKVNKNNLQQLYSESLNMLYSK